MKQNDRHHPTIGALWRGAIALLLVGAGACGDVMSLGDESIRFTVEDRIGTQPVSNDNTGGATAAAGQGVIVVAGRIVLPSSCYALSAQVQRNGAELVATITAFRTFDNCGTTPATRDYTLRIAELNTGTYHVRVFHTMIRETQESRLMLERDVAVN